MRRHLLILGCIAVMLVAGCVTPPAADDEDVNETSDTPQSTNVIQHTSLDADRIFAGGSTRLLLTLQNTRSASMNQVTTVIGNRGNLQLTRQEPAQNQLEQYACRHSQIPEGTVSDPSTRRCVWTVAASDSIVSAARNSVTYPLTAFVTYAATVAASDSLRVSFERQQDIVPGDRTQRVARAANEDVRVSLLHTSPVSESDGEVDVTITVENMGNGTIVSGTDEQRGISVRFEGTLADADWDMDQTTCADDQLKRKAVYFRDGAQQTQLSCTIVISESDLSGKTFSLRPRATYRYRVTQDTPLSIESPD